MYRLFSGLERRLGGIEVGPDRPIVGEATGDAFGFRLTTFLMQPLLAAEKLGSGDVIVVADGTAARPWSEGDLLWVERLRQLAAAWWIMLPAALTGDEATS
jgi:hypothetical protein